MSDAGVPLETRWARTLDAWAAADHYEAHEELEEIAEAFEAEDDDFEVAMALVHVAAAFHKLRNNVGPRAVPGKIQGALPALRRAPADWQGLALGAFVTELEATLAALQGREPLPVDLPLPLLRRRA